MAFFAGRLALDPRLNNPTVVVLTDRNDLDDQLFGTFAMCKELLRQTPQQAADRDDLRRLLDRPAGGVIFTALLDGTVLALDDETLNELWSINLGTGVNAAPVTYEVDGKQYLAIATGLTGNQIGRIATAPEMKGMAKNTTMLFVFGL